MITTRRWRRYSISHMIIVHLETVGFKDSLSFEIWIDIQSCGIMVMVVLKVSGEDIQWSGNRKQNVFDCMRHGGFVVVSSIVEFMFELLHMEEHCFGIIVYRYNQEENLLNDVADNNFYCLSGVNWSVSR